MCLLLLPSMGFSKSIVLNVVVADELAIQSSTSQILERLFKDRLPNAEFRRVIVQAGSPSVPHLFSDKNRVHNELKQKIAEILQPGDTLTYLILDTHGETKAGATRLWHLGDISFAGGVSAEFADLFDSVKPSAASDLTIVMNACSVFCGGENAAALRAETLLAYFGAVDGTIYGSTVPEVDTFAFEKKYSTWKDFMPSKKLFWISNSLGLMMSTTIALAVVATHDGNPWVYFGSTLAVMQALTSLRPYLMKAFEAMKMVNVGYLFQFHRGKLIKAEFIQKMKDVARSFALTGKVSSAEADDLFTKIKKSAFSTSFRCQFIFR